MSTHKTPSAPKRAIIIGGVNRDIKARFHKEARFLADSHQGLIARHDGGVARNIAEVLGRLGVPASLIGAFGDDGESRAMARHLEDYNVDLSHALIAEDSAADTYLAVHDHNGEMITAINQMPLIEMITPRYIATKAEVICQADFVICDCNLSEDTLQAIAALDRIGSLVIDAVSATKCHKIKPFMGHIDILKLSRNEALSLCDAPHNADDDTSAETLIHQLCARGITQTLISDGANGFAINEGDDIHHIAALKAVPQSVTGAGDCLLGGYIYGRANGYSVTASSAFGRQAAYLSTKSIAAINDMISPETLQLSSHEDPEAP